MKGVILCPMIGPYDPNLKIKNVHAFSSDPNLHFTLTSCFCQSSLCPGISYFPWYSYAFQSQIWTSGKVYSVENE